MQAVNGETVLVRQPGALLPAVARRQGASRSVEELPAVRAQDAFPGISTRRPIASIKHSQSGAIQKHSKIATTPETPNAWQEAATAIMRDKKAPELEVFQSTRGNKVVIFDWDDTLLPTSFIYSVVVGRRPAKLFQPVAKCSPFYASLASVAAIVRGLLVEACRFGQVGIVTLARRPWVTDSADRFLPGLHLQELARELDIPVYYASEYVCKHALKENPDRAFTAAKRASMEACARHFFGNAASCTSAMSIGDSMFEIIAVQELVSDLMNCKSPSNSQATLCKTLLLGQYTGLTPFQKRLSALLSHLASLDAHQGDLNLRLDQCSQCSQFHLQAASQAEMEEQGTCCDILLGPGLTTISDSHA